MSGARVSVFVLAAGIMVSAGASADDAWKPLEERCYDRGKFTVQVAIEACTQLIAHHSDNRFARSMALAQRGRQLAYARDFAAAMRDFDQAIELAPNKGLLGGFYAARGHALIANGRREAGEADFAKARLLDRGAVGPSWDSLRTPGPGAAAPGPAPTPVRPNMVDSTAAVAPAGGWAIRRPNGSLLPLPLAREVQVKGDVVTRPDSGMFSNYEFQVLLTGHAGSKFRIAWRSSDPVWLKYGEGYDARHRNDSKLTDLASWVDITLQKDGPQELTFAQSAGSAKASNCGAAGCNFSEVAPRPFLTTSMTVTRLDGGRPTAGSSHAASRPQPSPAAAAAGSTAELKPPFAYARWGMSQSALLAARSGLTQARTGNIIEGDDVFLGERVHVYFSFDGFGLRKVSIYGQEGGLKQCDRLIPALNRTYGTNLSMANSVVQLGKGTLLLEKLTDGRCNSWFLRY